MRSNGFTSPTYAMLLKDRVTFFEQWLLPVGCEAAQAEDWEFEFTGLLQTQPVYRTGNYNVQPTNPPAFAAAAVSTLTTYAVPAAI